jgi:hypothetical protein
MMKISRHARNNMRLYKISEDDIMSAVESPDVSATEENRMIAMKKFRDKFSGYPLKVVYEKIKGEIFILTAYPLKKKMGR